jgi:ElaB/YqjD/DUF883 family membrane-anchored ribosome-binding protein
VNPIKSVENIVRLRDELREMRDKLEHIMRELDAEAGEIIRFLKANNMIETKK